MMMRFLQPGPPEDGHLAPHPEAALAVEPDSYPHPLNLEDTPCKHMNVVQVKLSSHVHAQYCTCHLQLSSFMMQISCNLTAKLVQVSDLPKWSLLATAGLPC